MQHLFLLNKVFLTPLEALFTLLIFILNKELHATPLQLTLLASAKPVVSLVAFYVSSFVVGKPYRIKPLLLTLVLIASLPCLAFPWMQNAWYFIIAYALFMIALRSSFPLWIELLKQQIGVQKMAGVVAKGSCIHYVMLILVPLVVSLWMDQEPEAWKALFVCFALIQLSTVFILFCLKTPSKLSLDDLSPLLSWKEGWRLLKRDPPFTHYQILFFLGGAGLVALQPILPIFFNETLHLSYTELALAFSVCRGVGFILTSPWWVKQSKSLSLYLLNGIVNVLSCLFIGFLLASIAETSWLFLAYLMYGAMQAGCELSWNLSGPLFAQAKESTLYSGLSLFFTGLRGCVCPFLGSFLWLHTSLYGVFLFAVLGCLLSVLYAFWLEARYKNVSIVAESCP